MYVRFHQHENLQNRLAKSSLCGRHLPNSESIRQIVTDSFTHVLVQASECSQTNCYNALTQIGTDSFTQVLVYLACRHLWNSECSWTNFYDSHIATDSFTQVLVYLAFRYLPNSECSQTNYYDSFRTLSHTSRFT